MVQLGYGSFGRFASQGTGAHRLREVGKEEELEGSEGRRIGQK